MSLTLVTLEDFRIFEECRFEPDPEGTTVITGPNGTGKTTVLEAVAYLGTQRSFRGAQRESMVRTGRERAVIRAELTRAGLPLLVEAEVAAQGRSRAQVNRQPVRSRRDLAEAVPVTVFSPEDLGLVQGAPGAPARAARRCAGPARPEGGRPVRRGRPGAAPARGSPAPGRGSPGPRDR